MNSSWASHKEQNHDVRILASDTSMIIPFGDIDHHYFPSTIGSNGYTHRAEDSLTLMVHMKTTQVEPVSKNNAASASSGAFNWMISPMLLPSDQLLYRTAKLSSSADPIQRPESVFH